MSATRLDLIGTLAIDQGGDWSVSFPVRDQNGNPADLAGFTGACQIRAWWGAPSVLATPTVTIDTGTSTVTLALANAATSALPPASAWYDVRLTDGSGLRTFTQQGLVQVNPATTRA
jgi:hypothetical protein